MKSKFFSKTMKFAWVLVVAFLAVFSSCKKDTPEPDPTPVVEDGWYVKGDATALTELDAKGLMNATTNEADDNAERSQLLQIYIAVKGGTAGFNIVHVVGGTATTMGPGSDFAEITGDALDAEEPQNGLWRGSLAESTTAFTVPEDGLYHIVYDTELEVVAIAKADWGIIGGATPAGWGSNDILQAGTFDLNKITFEATDVIMTVDTWKFRYANGWKIFMDGDAGLIKANTNFGGTVAALVTGGGNIANTVNGYYTVNITWELGKAFVATQTKTADYIPAAYPDAMYIVGDATAYGWPAADPNENADAVMHKIAGGGDNDGIFWKICSLTGGGGFKITAAGWGAPNLGFAEVDEYDANGVTVSDNGGNMSVATSGMYMVVLDLRNSLKKVSIMAPVVYGMGDAFGANDWAEDAASCLFTVDDVAKTLTSPALTADGNIRMYADHAWIPAWWNAEFNVYSGVIEYRNDGGDQTAVPGTTGQVITLTFDDNTAAIAK